jgi:hypothetical protein
MATPSALPAITTGSPAPNLTGYSYTLSGYLGNDAADDSVTGSLNGSTPYTMASLVGTYAINYQGGGLASLLGYGFTYGSNPNGVIVNGPAITGNEVSRIAYPRPSYEVRPTAGGESFQQAERSAASGQDGSEFEYSQLPPASGGNPKRGGKRAPFITVDPELQTLLGLPPTL